ncbi:hypothetical protein B0T13DRAFT_452085 [Neurospora crassa]|nr:hypothetical protein B0T13DRAFT_452085 [Neurospora crassa]
MEKAKKEKGKLSGTGRDQQKRAGSTARTGRARGMDKVKQGVCVSSVEQRLGNEWYKRDRPASIECFSLTSIVLSLPGPLQPPSQRRKNVVTRRASFNDIVAGRFDSDVGDQARPISVGLALSVLRWAPSRETGVTLRGG